MLGRASKTVIMLSANQPFLTLELDFTKVRELILHFLLSFKECSQTLFFLFSLKLPMCLLNLRNLGERV